MALHTIIAFVPPVPVFIGAWQELVLPIPNNRTAVLSIGCLLGSR